MLIVDGFAIERQRQNERFQEVAELWGDRKMERKVECMVAN